MEEGKPSPIPTLIIIAVLIGLAAWVVANSFGQPEFFARAPVTAGVGATILTLIVGSLLILVNNSDRNRRE